MGAYGMVIKETKMKKKILFLFLLAGFINSATTYSAENVADVVKMLNSNDWAVRDRGVAVAAKVSNNDQVRIELIKLLERENKQFEDLAEREEKHREMNPSSTEQEMLSPDVISGEYYIDVIKAVVALKDPRAIKSLVGAVDTGNAVPDALISFGEAAIDPLIDTFVTSKRRPIKPDIIRTLNKVLAERTVSVARKSKVKHFLLDQVNKVPSENVKRNMVAAFANFPDDDQVITILESLIASDTYYEMRRVKGRPRTETVKVFTVREEAKKTLGRIKAKRREKHKELPAGTTQQNKTP